MLNPHWAQFMPAIRTAQADGSATAWHKLRECYYQGLADDVSDMTLLLAWAAREGIGRIPTWDPRFDDLILYRGGLGWTANELVHVVDISELTAPTKSKDFVWGELFWHCKRAFGDDHPGVRKMAEVLARN